MGVTGLWKLIDQSGTPVPLETLENKVLAVDISIWLHQSVKGFQDASGAGLPHAHLLGLYHRICKLLYYRIKPVFVFDGGIPYLKRETIRKRNASKVTYRTEADRLQKLLAQSVEREKLIRHALGEPSTSTAISPQKERIVHTEKDDMFILPPIPEDELNKTSSSLDQSSSSVEECTPKNYNVNLQTIDVTSKHFLSLPADVRHEILTDIKGMRKESSWGRLHELPEESNEFSGFQMQRLLKRRQVQKSLEAAEQEMGGQSLSFAELEKLLLEDGVVQDDVDAYPTKRVHSDENTRYLHVRNLKKAMREEEKRQTSVDVAEEEGSSSPKKQKRDDEFVMDTVQLSDENDDDEEKETVDEDEDEDEQLQRAIQMSLEECRVVEGPSTSDVVKPLIDIKTEPELIQNEPELHRHEAVFNPPEPEPKLLLSTLIEVDKKSSETIVEDTVSDVSSNADSDFIDVPEADSDTSLTLPSQISFELNIAAPPDLSTDFRHDDLKLFQGKPAKCIEVVIDPNVKPEDDLFADVFKTEIRDNKSEASENSFESVEDKVKIDFQVANTAPANLESILNKLNAEMDSLVKQESVQFGTNNTSSTEKKPIGIRPNSENDEIISAIADNKEKDLEHSIESNEIQHNSENENICEKGIEPKLTIDYNEVIEIDDEDEELKSKNFKQTNIGEFINITPKKEKSTAEIIDTTTPPPKVASPFFRKKTPSSSSKKSQSGSAPNTPTTAKHSKKSLFPDNPDPMMVLSEPKSHADIREEVATELRDQLGVGELSEMAQEYRQNTRDLLMERNKQDRMGTSITDRMSDDCKRLLRIFGIPFVVAPMEAEAQCAYLDVAHLTDGTITDDSDIWLFGGQTVYKHFFNQAKTVQEFRSESVKRLFNVDRDNLIQMAMLVGSDYTTGVAGVGMVTALEILSAFPSAPNTPAKEGICNEQVLIAKLRKFKEWLTNTKAGTNVRLRTKLKNVLLSDEFPNIQIVQSYLYPEVNDQLEPFSWRAPDAETLREFAKTTFGWTFSKTDETLLPVLKRAQEKKSQSSIRNYFTTQGIIDRKEVAVSKRVRKAIDRMANGSEEDLEKDDPKEKPKRARKPKTSKSLNSQPVEEKEGGIKDPKPSKRTGRVPRELASTSKTENESAKSHPAEEEESKGPNPRKRSGRVPRDTPSTSTTVSKSPLKTPRIPDFQPPIRQRELAAEQQEKIRAEAVAVFKKSKQSNGRKK